MPIEGEQKVVFEQTIDALFVRALAPKLTLRCSERLKAAGVDLNKKLRPAYPLEVWNACLKIAAEEIHPGASADVALRRLGQQLVEGFREAGVGKAVLAKLKVTGPKRALEQAAHNFRTGNNYTETRLTESSPNCFELWVNEVGDHPAFIAGIIEGGLRTAGAILPSATVASYDGHACTLRVTWESAPAR